MLADESALAAAPRAEAAAAARLFDLEEVDGRAALEETLERACEHAPSVPAPAWRLASLREARGDRDGWRRVLENLVAHDASAAPVVRAALSR